MNTSASGQHGQGHETQTSDVLVTDPDQAEQESTLDLDNVVPTRGYQMLPLVGLGGSAGSIGALQSFFKSVPPDSGTTFVVILHLSAEHDSTLAELLQRSTAMPVKQACNGDKIEADHVYVIPPGKALSVTNGQLRLSELLHRRGRRVAVDLFFRSLADTHGPHAAAIVLSGADGDGAMGIKRIKERGGLTIAQDPQEAERDSMPRTAIATGMVDWVLPVHDMAERILKYLRLERELRLPPEDVSQPALQPKAPPAPEETALRDVLSFLQVRTGRDFSYYKRATILRRIARRMQVNGVHDLGAYLEVLRATPGESGALLQDLLISVTNFFRDADCFAALEAHMPELFRNKTQNDTVRVWVAACATGEEAYAVAILLSEHANKMAAPPLLQVFATDLDGQAIQAARSGVYPSTIAADVSDDRLSRCFVKEFRGYRLRREIREIVLFAEHDLLKDSPFSRLDMISCRNLLIYLNRDAQSRALEIFHFALNVHGRLFLGSSESVDETSPLFATLDKKHRLYARRPMPVPRAGVPLLSGKSTLALALEAQNKSIEAHVAADRSLEEAKVMALRLDSGARVASWGELHLKLLERLAPPSLVVNADHNIVHLSESAGRYLQYIGGEPSQNLLRLVQPALRIELRAALFRAAQTGMMAEVLNVPLELGGGPFEVTVRVMPAEDIAPGYLLLVFDARAPSQASGLARVEVPRVEPDAVARHLDDELEKLKSHLRDTVEQYEASTEELKASNEELQAMNEELRSATEELETSREELQSINEELTTVNAELKNKVDELSQSNSDLHNLMGATAIATVFLDRDLRITRYTPPAVALFKLIPTDVGRPLTDLTTQLDYPDIGADALSVLRQLTPIQREVGQLDGGHFLANLLPYRTLEDRIAGVVLTFVDITERRRTEEALRASEARFRAIVNQTTAGIAYADLSGRVVFANQRLAEILHLPQQELAGQPIFNLADGRDWPVHREALARTLSEGVPTEFEMRLARRDGGFCWVQVNVSGIRDAQGVLQSVVAVILDISESKRAEDELRASIGVREEVEAALLKARVELEERVLDRTAELADTNQILLGEVDERRAAEMQVRDLLGQLVSAQEDERRRISRELHDTLGQHLAVLGIGLKAIEEDEDCSSGMRQRLAHTRTALSRLEDALDRLSHELRPTSLDDLGLEDALRRHAEAWSKDSSVPVDVQCRGLRGRRLPEALETAVYRTVQEALTNVYKHARATRVGLIVERRWKELRVIVEDDGQGFDKSAVTLDPNGRRRIGLKGMAERAMLVGGRIEVESEQGKGTTIYLIVPLTSPNNPEQESV